MPKVKAGNITISYETHGEGEPLLLIMGFGGPGAAWLPFLPFLTGFKCLYYDNRGTGHSDKPDCAYTIEDMAEDASNLLRALGIPRAKVFGVSMGGMIAQELTLRHPEQVVKVVLGCTTPAAVGAMPPSGEAIERLAVGNKLMASDPAKAYDLLMPVMMPPEFVAAHPELKAVLLAGRSMSPPTPPETADRTMAGISRYDAYDRLPQIKCPVLIVHGDRDMIVPTANAELIKRQIPHAEMYIVPNAGHVFQMADLPGVHRRIVDWLKA